MLSSSEIENIAVQFNAYGVTDELKYFSQHFGNVLHTITSIKPLKLSQFKFKFIGWQRISPEPLLKEILNIETSNIDINISNTPGSQGIVKQIIQIVANGARTYISVRVILAKQSSYLFSWKAPYKCLKLFERLNIVNEPKIMTIEFSGWGQEQGVHQDAVMQFFGLKSKDECQKAIKQFHGWLRNFFDKILVASVERELNFDMRNWNEKYKIKDLKKELDVYIKEKCPLPSLISSSANLENQKLQKINIQI